MWREAVDQRRGIAIISMLLVLVAVGAVAAGISAITLLNVRVGQNVRSQVLAKASADNGLDFALIAVANAYRGADGEFPTQVELLARVPADPTYALTRYVVDDSGPQPVAEIAFTGFALRGSSGAFAARHTVSALIRGAVEPVENLTPGTGFGVGFVTNDDIVISGGGTFLLGMHAGGSINVNGTVAIGEYSYLAAGSQCRLGGSATSELCRQGPAPVIDPFVYSVAANRLAVQVDAPTSCLNLGAGGSEANQAVPINLTGYSNRVLCVGSGFFSFTGSAGNVTILGETDTVVDFRASIDSSLAGDGNDWGIRMAVGDVMMNNSPALIGRNEIYAWSTVALDKDVTTTTPVQVDGQVQQLVKTFVAAGRDIAFRGGGGTTTAIVGLANRAFCEMGAGGGNNPAIFMGTMTVSGETITPSTQLSNSDTCGNNASGISFSGRTTARLPFGIVTPEPEDPTVEVTYDAAGIRVVSRRP